MMSWTDDGVRFNKEERALWECGTEFIEVIVVAALPHDYYNVRPIGYQNLVLVHADRLHAPEISLTDQIV